MRQQTAADIEFMGQMYSPACDRVKQILNQLFLRLCQFQKTVAYLLRFNGIIHPEIDIFRHTAGIIFGTLSS